MDMCSYITSVSSFFFQAEDGIRYLVRSRGLVDVYKRQVKVCHAPGCAHVFKREVTAVAKAIILKGCTRNKVEKFIYIRDGFGGCLLYTSDAADERSSVDLGGRRIIKKRKKKKNTKHNKFGIDDAHSKCST